MANNRFALPALFLLLAVQAVFPLWSQNVNITVVDMAGLPVKAATVEITYQKADIVSHDDGMARGQTGEDGSFYAVLSNSVSSGPDNRTYAVNVSTYYWPGSVAMFEADNSRQKKIRFPIPFELESVQIRAIPADAIKPGAQADIYGSPVSEYFGANGAATVHVPKGLQFSGYIVSDGKRRIFYSVNATVDTAGHRTIDVWLPDSWRSDGAAQSAKRISVSLAFVSPNGEPYFDLPVTYLYRGKEQSALTDASGTATFDAFSGIPLNLTFVIDEYSRNIFYTANESKNGTVKLGRLMSIEILPPSQEGENCYRAIANVSDPRKQLPLQVLFESRAGGAVANMTPSTDEFGRLFVRTCVAADTNLTVRASNKYESAEASVALRYSPPQPSPGQGAQPGFPPGQPQAKPQAENYFLWALLTVFAALVAGMVFFAKKSLGASSSFILNYLRLMYGSVQKTRRPVPAPAKKSYDGMEQPEPAQAQPQSQGVQPEQKKQGLLESLFHAKKKKDAPSSNQAPPPSQPEQE